MLKVLAIVIGILVVVGRGLGVIFPELLRKMMKGMLNKPVISLVLMVPAVVLGGLFILGYRLWVDQNPTTWQAVILLILGIIMAAAGLLFLAVPKLYTGLLEKFSDVEALKLRLLCALGVVVGVLIILLGVGL